MSSYRGDGSLRPYVTIWTVRVGEEIYIRSAYGRDNGWFKRALASGAGRIRAGGVEKEVAFLEPEASAHAAIDAAYHSKYDRYGHQIVGSVTGPHAVGETFLLVPQN